MAKAKLIRDYLVTSLQGIRDAGGNPVFNEVLTRTQGQYDGSPTAIVLPKQYKNDTLTTAQNMRTAEFSILVIIPFGTDPADEQAAYDNMLDLTDYILDELDTITADPTPTLGTLIFKADFGAYEVTESDNGATLYFRVDTHAEYLNDI